MTSPRPYLLRALIDWIVDNGRTPHMVIDCTVQGVEVPAEHAGDGKLTLNISASAVRNFSLGDKRVSMDCRFHGRPRHINAPVGAVVAVYAKETGMGMGFEVERGEPDSDQTPTKPAQRPHLKLVK